MIALRPYADSVVRLVRYLRTSSHAKLWVDIPTAPVYDIVGGPADKRTRALKHLIKANHVNHALYYHNLLFHNHVSYSLASAYAFGADADQLERVYEEESRTLEPLRPSPAEISDRDWRERLGDRRYYKAYIDFFEDELALKYSYDWKLMTREFMYNAEEPMLNNLIGGRTCNYDLQACTERDDSGRG